MRGRSILLPGETMECPPITSTDLRECSVLKKSVVSLAVEGGSLNLGVSKQRAIATWVICWHQFVGLDELVRVKLFLSYKTVPSGP